MLAIETKNLTKTYQGHGGYRGISLAVPQGCIFGLLGPNGAGKSTLVKTLVGLLQHTSGEAKLLGRPLNDVYVRKKVGFLPENFRYHDWLTGEDLLKFHASLFGLSTHETTKRISEVLHMVGLSDHGHKRVGNYSKGMQQRIGLGCALISDPDLLFLDEPTSALDPIGRKMVRDLIVTLREQGKTIFLNSHLLSELETVCEHIAIIRDGQLVFQGNWREISSRGYRVKIVVQGEQIQEKLLSLSSGTFDLVSHSTLGEQRNGSTLQEMVIACPGSTEVPQLVKILVEAGIQLYEVSPMMDSLEKLFLHFVDNKSSEGR